MKATITTTLVALILITASTTLAQPTTHLWSQSSGGTTNDDGSSVAIDASGNVFMAGSFQGTVDFGGGSLVSAGSSDIVVAKYSPTGAHLWSQRFGSTGQDFGISVATDAAGNVFMTGQFNETVDFGGGSLVSAGSNDIVVAKYSPTGTHLWSQRFGSTSNDVGYSVATDSSGNVFMTALFIGSVDFGGGALVSAGARDIVVAKYSPTGTHLWSQRFGDTGQDIGISVATDAFGNVFLTADFSGSVDFGGGTLVSAGGFDIVVAKYSPTGIHLWSQQFGGPSSDNGKSVATDASGNVFVTAQFNGTVTFGGGSLVGAGGADIVVAKYGPTGTHLWSQGFGSTGRDVGLSVAADASGNVFMTGYFEGSVDFGDGTLASAGGLDIVVAKYSPSGTHLWSRRFGSTSNDVGTSVATDAAGNVFMTALFIGSVDFGGGALVSAGTSDIVIAEFGATATAVGDTPGSRVALASNFPNPFNPSTTITYSIPVTGHVELEIYDLAGRHVSTLVSDHVSVGEHQVQWNGTGDTGAQVASGVYLYQLRAGDFVETKRMVLLK